VVLEQILAPRDSGVTKWLTRVLVPDRAGRLYGPIICAESRRIRSPRTAQSRKLRDIAAKKGNPLSSYPDAIKLVFGFSHSRNFAVSAGNLPCKVLQR
jgi:hypothetical protein